METIRKNYVGCWMLNVGCWTCRQCDGPTGMVAEYTCEMIPVLCSLRSRFEPQRLEGLQGFTKRGTHIYDTGHTHPNCDSFSFVKPWSPSSLCGSNNERSEYN